MTQVNWPQLFDQGRARTTSGPAFDDADWELIKSKKKTAQELQAEYTREKVLADAEKFKETAPRSVVETTTAEIRKDSKEVLIKQITSKAIEAGVEDDYRVESLTRCGISKLEEKLAEVTGILIKQANS